MSISSVGSSSTTSSDALQQQLATDQKTLTNDQAKKASQQTVQADQTKVTADQKAINEAPDKTGATSAGGVDISV